MQVSKQAAASPVRAPADTGDAAPTAAWKAFLRRHPFGLALALTAGFLAFAFQPRAQANPRLLWTYVGVAAALFAWQLLLSARARRRGLPLAVELAPPAKSHYVQGSVQLTIYAYWGWYWRDIYAEAPLILSQLVFLYVFDALLSWSLGRRWRLGFAPLPIVLSINVFIWFRDDWFALQFVLVAICALGKEFVKWTRDGRRTHVFNPSAFGLTVVSLFLIVTGTTKELTWARELATTIDEAPYIFALIFGLGLIVQYHFAVTLMTLSATAVMCLLNLEYTHRTGVYQFVNTNLSAAVFLGIHLLVTDPSTSPRTNGGRVLFGALYGLGNWVLFDVLAWFGAPELYTKLLVVPVLNLGVIWIDRVASIGPFAGWDRRAAAALGARGQNLVHMGVWAAIFATMWATRFIAAPHPGNSIAFWKKADAEKKPDAGRKLVLVTLAHAADGSGAANTELGLICMEGRLAKQSNGNAARYFAKACELRDESGCANVAVQFHFLRQRRSDEDVALALDRLEQDCLVRSTGRNCFLVGFAYESGHGRPLDTRRAREVYVRAGPTNLYAVKGLARLALAAGDRQADLGEVAHTLARACDASDAESCWYLAYMHLGGYSVPRDARKARNLLEQACRLGSKDACAALERSEIPPYAAPVLDVPSWSSPFPLL